MARILVDRREKKSSIPELLEREGVKVIFGNLPVGDYVLSERIIAERKSLYDFATSVKNKRIFRQIDELRESCEMPILIVEGESLSNVKGIKHKGLLGALALITVYYRVPVIFTKNKVETAEFLALVAKREAMELSDVLSVFHKKKARTKEEMMLRVIEAMPDIGPKRARELLKRFGNLQRLFNATYEELISIPGFGHTRALKFLKFVREGIDEELEQEV